jgi:ABC-type multidrug transport system ATPase subunit
MAEDEKSSIQLAFRNLCIFDANTRAPLLHDVSGFVLRGGLTAVLGPSSSGKTLLTKALTGSMHDAYCTGEVLLQGQVMAPGSAETRSRVVLEDDQLVGVLTVRESLLLATRLRRDLDQAACEAVVDDLIAQLDLGSAANTLIGTALRRGISGGQKRRTSAAMELVALARA